MKTWKPWPGINCPDCGCETEVESDHDAADGICNDEDRLRCSDNECQRHSQDLGCVLVLGDGPEVVEQFDEWPIGEDDKPYRPAEDSP